MEQVSATIPTCSCPWGLLTMYQEYNRRETSVVVSVPPACRLAHTSVNPAATKPAAKIIASQSGPVPPRMQGALGHWIAGGPCLLLAAQSNMLGV